MKKIVTFLILIIVVLLCSCGKEDDPVSEYEQELLTKSNNSTEMVYQKNEKISKIKEFYIPNSELMIMGKCIYYHDIEETFPCNNIKKTDYGSNMIYYLDTDETFVVVANDDDVVSCMLYYGTKLYDVELFSKVNNGMSLEEISEIFPSYIIYEKTEIIELVFDNGQIGIIELEKNNDMYFVKDKYISVLSVDAAIINSLT